MWKRYGKQIGAAATVTGLGVLLLMYGLTVEAEYAAYLRTLAMLPVLAGFVALTSILGAASRHARATAELYAQWTAADGTRAALYRRAVLADGVLHDLSAPGVRVLSRTYEHGVLTLEYTYPARGGARIERVVLSVPDEADEAARRFAEGT